MPELPEVEVVKLGLKKTTINKKIKQIEVKNNKIVSGHTTKREADSNKKIEFENALKNATISNVLRIGKNIIIETDRGCILVHLKMTGQFAYFLNTEALNNANYKDSKHFHIYFYLTDGSVLIYKDIRKFGYALYFSSIENLLNSDHILKQGIDPTNKIGEEEACIILKKFSKKSSSIKKSLLDQSIICGVGNIYADEILFRSFISPKSITKNINLDNIKTILINAKDIFNDSIIAGGSSISDYQGVDGARGNYVQNHKVYGRKGKLCFVCDTLLSGIVDGGRATVYCEICQKVM